MSNLVALVGLFPGIGLYNAEEVLIALNDELNAQTVRSKNAISWYWPVLSLAEKIILLSLMLFRTKRISNKHLPPPLTFENALDGEIPNDKILCKFAVVSLFSLSRVRNLAELPGSFPGVELYKTAEFTNDLNVELNAQIFRSKNAISR